MDNMEIIEAIRSGDKEAIKNVYKDHAKDVYNFAKSITGEHESAMAATKKTFVNLFTSIQKGENPTNIRLTALKMAYDEACAIALPSTENIDSPFDRKEEAAEPVQEEAAAEAPIATAGVVGDGIIDTKEEMDEVMDEANTDEPIVDETEDIPAAEEDGTKYVKFDAQDEDKLSNTQVFSIKEAMDGEDEVEMSDEEYDDEYDDDDYDDDEDDYEPAPRSKVATIIIVVINVLLVILLVWLLYGLLVSFGVISDIAHIGFTYKFFNEHIYPIF